MQEEPSPATIPTDAIIVRQSRWAYMLYTIPALAFCGAISYFDFLTGGLWPFMMASYFIVSRYLSFRRTAYILTDKHLTIFQGSLVGRKRFDIPFTDLNYIQAQPGIFGSRLEYTGVILQLTDQRVFSLDYVPVESPLLEHLRARMNPDSLQKDDLGEKF